MYLFSRRSQIAGGQIVDGVSHALELTRIVTSVTGMPVATWSTVMSSPVGGLGWSTVFDDLDQTNERMGALMADSAYLAAATKAADLYLGPPTDVLSHVVHGGPAPDGPPAYASVVVGELAPGAFTAGMAAGVEVAMAAESVTGRPTIFLKSLTGDYAGVGWISGAASLREVQDANTAMMADAGWAALLDRVGGSFQPGAQSQLLRRLS